MQNELHIFIIWNQAHRLQQPIIDDLMQHFEIRKIFNCHWEKKTFAVRLSQFYHKKLFHSCRKEKECGNDDFLLIVIQDNAPVYKNNINLNVRKLKEKYRRWSGGNYLIHASDNKDEAEENLKFLTNLDHQSFLKKYPNIWNGSSIDNLSSPPLAISRKEKFFLKLSQTARMFL